jgi:hypothetical protein
VDLTKLIGKKMDMGKLVAAILEHIDMPALISSVMSGLQLKDLELYFVVVDEYDFNVVGMAYSKEAAQSLMDDYNKETKHKRNTQVLRLDIGKLVQLAREAGAVEEVA